MLLSANILVTLVHCMETPRWTPHTHNLSLFVRSSVVRMLVYIDDSHQPKLKTILRKTLDFFRRTKPSRLPTQRFFNLFE